VFNKRVHSLVKRILTLRVSPKFWHWTALVHLVFLVTGIMCSSAFCVFIFPTKRMQQA